jgi:hypothetical protein
VLLGRVRSWEYSPGSSLLLGCLYVLQPFFGRRRHFLDPLTPSKLGNLPQPFRETEVYRQESAKRGSMHTDEFKDILEEFPAAFDGVKPLCRELRSILFPLTRDGELDLAT